MQNDLNLCPACLSIGELKYPEKIESVLFNELTYASRKRPELMHYDLYECELCKTLFTNRNVNLSELLKIRGKVRSKNICKKPEESTSQLQWKYS